MIKIAITDDHELFRIGLSELLKKQEDFQIVAELSNGQEFLDFLSEKKSRRYCFIRHYDASFRWI